MTRLQQATCISGAATVVIPAVWAVLTTLLPGNSGLAVGWYGVVWMLVIVPLGLVVTVVLAVTALLEASTSSNQDDAGDRDEPEA